jgi:hypothetical protein
LEALATAVGKLETKAKGANEFVSQVKQVQANALAALRNAEEATANQGKTQAELYAEGKAKQAANEANATKRAEEAKRQENLGANM